MSLSHELSSGTLLSPPTSRPCSSHSTSPIPSPSTSPAPSLPASLPFQLTSCSQHFQVRSLVPSDFPYIRELARYVYEGKDFIIQAFPLWMKPQSQLPPTPLGIVYLGPASPPSSPAEDDPRAAFVGHVVATEVALYLDDGETAWLYALRVHPHFRGLSLSSLLHGVMIKEVTSNPRVRRVRESVERSNTVSLHLGRKFRFAPTFDASFHWVYRHEWHTKMEALRALLRHHHIDPTLATPHSHGRGGLLAPGSLDDVMAIRARHHPHPAFTFLVQSWIAYEFTRSNLERLTTEPGLQHEVEVSYEEGVEAGRQVRVPTAFTLTQYTQDFSSATQVVSVYAADVRHLLVHLYAAMQRQAEHVEDEAKYARPMLFLPSCFEQDLRAEAACSEATEGGFNATTPDGGVWAPNMFFICLERPAVVEQ